MEIFSGIFVIIWVIALISFISKAVGASKTQQRPTRPNTPYTGTQNQQPAPTDTARPASQAQTFRNTPGATYGSSNTSAGAARPRSLSSYGQSGASSSGYSQRVPASSSYSQNKTSAMFGQVKASRIGENNVLLEDRKNDWLAKQLKEEAAIARRGSVYDLGASHEVSCDADRIKREHIKRHNTNGLNRGMFR